MKIEDVELFIKTNEQMNTLYREISLLSQKKPNDSMNKFRLNLINRVLSNSNLILKEQFKPFPEFCLFDDSELPSNSDVTVMLSQYLNSMERFRSKNIKMDYQKDWIWNIDNNNVKIETHPPSN